MSKTEAEGIRDRLRGQIREGTLIDPDTPTPEAKVTFGDVVDRYLDQHVRLPTRRPRATKEMEYHLATLRRAEVPDAGHRVVRLENKPIDGITKADVEAFRQGRRTSRQATAKGGEVGINRLLARLRHVFS